MKTTMLEHQKKVIANDSYNEEQFHNEIAKSRDWLNENDFKKLQNWMESNFQKKHKVE